MAVQGIDVSHNIWGNSVPDLKVKTTRNKTIPVSGYLVQIQEDMVNLHKDIYLTTYMLFINSIPFFLDLSRKKGFTAVNYIDNRKVETIFKDFKEIYSYYMKCEFHITTLHVDGEFSPLQYMIYEHIPVGKKINIIREN